MWSNSLKGRAKPMSPTLTWRKDFKISKLIGNVKTVRKCQESAGCDPRMDRKPWKTHSGVLFSSHCPTAWAKKHGERDDSDRSMIFVQLSWFCACVQCVFLVWFFGGQGFRVVHQTFYGFVVIEGGKIWGGCWSCSCLFFCLVFFSLFVLGTGAFFLIVVLHFHNISNIIFTGISLFRCSRIIHKLFLPNVLVFHIKRRVSMKNLGFAKCQ